jgi:thioredoxin 1
MYITIAIIGSIIIAFIAYVYYTMLKMKRMPAVADHQKIVQLNDSNFKKNISNGIVLVDFWAEWCMPCKMMTPIINAVADETQENVSVGKLNIDHARQTAAKFNVRSIPTLIIFKNGKEGKRIVGVKTKDFIIDQINQMSKK